MAVAGLIVPRAVVAVVPAAVLMANIVAATGRLAAAIVVVAACSGCANRGGGGVGDPYMINNAGGFAVPPGSVSDVLHQHVVCIIISGEVARAEEVSRRRRWCSIVSAVCYGVMQCGVHIVAVV